MLTLLATVSLLLFLFDGSSLTDCYKLIRRSGNFRQRCNDQLGYYELDSSCYAANALGGCFQKRAISSLTMQLQQSDVEYPTKIKNVLSKLTASTQRALQDRNSRIGIELPPGADFGVEKKSKSSITGTDKDRIITSNREAARLITEMFSILSDTTVVLFPTEVEAAKARNLWSNKFKGKVLSIDVPAPKGYSNLRSRRFSAEQQEQALLATDGIYVPEATELLIVAGPRTKDMRKIRSMHEALGFDTLIILLNARLQSSNPVAVNSAAYPTDATAQLTATFENAFHYAPPMLDSSSYSNRDLLLYHEYKGKWYLAEKPPKVKAGDEVAESNVFDTVGSFIGGLTSGNRNDGFNTLWEGDRQPCQEDIIQCLKS